MLINVTMEIDQPRAITVLLSFNLHSTLHRYHPIAIPIKYGPIRVQGLSYKLS